MAKLLYMGRKKLGRVPKNITLPPDLAECAEETAKEEGRTLSSLIEDLLRGYLRKYGLKKKGGAKK